MKEGNNRILDLGAKAYEEGKLREAESLFRSLLTSEPAQSEAIYFLGLIGTCCGDYDSAISFFRSAIAINAQEPRFWSGYLSALIKKGEIYEARDLLAYALHTGIDPQDSAIADIALQLHPSTKLDFYYRYLQQLCMQI